jgi:hypothetical protein
MSVEHERQGRQVAYDELDRLMDRGRLERSKALHAALGRLWRWTRAAVARTSGGGAQAARGA